MQKPVFVTGFCIFAQPTRGPRVEAFIFAVQDAVVVTLNRGCLFLLWHWALVREA